MKRLLSFLVLPFMVQAGIYEPHTLWDKREVVTCFYSQKSQLIGTNLISYDYAKKEMKFLPRALSKSEREQVKRTVMAHYRKDVTGIYFTGFKDCSETASPDLIILEAKGRFLILNPSFAGRAVIGDSGAMGILDGMHGFFSKSGKIATVALNTVRTTTIVHEFGHVAGLRHEHIHPDAKEDPQCQGDSSPINLNKPDKLEKIYDTAIFHTDYDHESIMNYCYYFRRRPEIDQGLKFVLSPNDIKTLQEMYPFF